MATDNYQFVYQRIMAKAIEILAEKKELTYAELKRLIAVALPDVPENSIVGTLGNIVNITSKIIKPERGLYVYVEGAEDVEVPQTPTNKPNIKENVFYAPFADFLVTNTEECSVATELGGNVFGGKWGTPDVIGIKRSSEADHFKMDMEIVSAEIKTNSADLITAFGQACAYQIFSHKVYIVTPKDSNLSDIKRLESLSLIFGIGFVLFDSNSSEFPNFTIRVRPRRYEPDKSYVNFYLSKIIGSELFK